MRKRTTIVLGCLAVFGIPAAAYAGSTQYTGYFENAEGQMAFVLDTRDDSTREVEEFNFYDFPLTCKGKEKTTTGFISSDMEVVDDEFSDKVILGPENNPKATLKVEGTIPSPGVASGTMKISGRKVPIDGGGRKKCKSGSNSWAATDF